MLHTWSAMREVWTLAATLLFACGNKCPPVASSPPIAATPVAPSSSSTASTASPPPPAPPPPRVHDPWTPWDGPVAWSREPLKCKPLDAKPPAQTVSGWKTLTRGTPSSLTAVSVSRADVNDVWIVGTEGTILHTADHGASFTVCTLDSREALTSVWAASRDDVWMLSDEHVFRIEQGTTLATLSVPLGGHCGTPRNSLFGLSPTDVWLANGVLLHTTDRGATWSRVRACGDQINDGCTSEIQGNAAELWTDCPFFAHGSTDHGATWPLGAGPGKTEEQVHIAAGPDDVWVVGQSSQYIARSTDHGATWTEHGLAKGASGGSVFGIWSAEHGWAWVSAGDGIWTSHGWSTRFFTPRRVRGVSRSRRGRPS
jgi:photosystem II stability/assembly factor-like uncharacterized protein